MKIHHFHKNRGYMVYPENRRAISTGKWRFLRKITLFHDFDDFMRFHSKPSKTYDLGHIKGPYSALWRIKGTKRHHLWPYCAIWSHIAPLHGPKAPIGAAIAQWWAGTHLGWRMRPKGRSMGGRRRPRTPGTGGRSRP